MGTHASLESNEQPVGAWVELDDCGGSPDAWLHAERQRKRAADERQRIELNRRLQADLADHPESPTLQRVALLVNGREGDLALLLADTELVQAYVRGAPAADIAEGEDLMAQAAEYRGFEEAGDFLRRLRDLNRRLRSYTREPQTIIVRSIEPYRRYVAFRTAMVLARVASERAMRFQVSGHAPPGRGWNPPPLASATVAPLHRTGPPSALVRAAA